MNEPLGIALELMQKRRALAARLSPLARRLAFPEHFDRHVAKRAPVPPKMRAVHNDWDTVRRETLRTKALRVEPQATAIVKVCASAWGVPAGQIYDCSRKAIYVRPRQAAMAMMRDILKISLPTIGMILNRDHSTVMSGIAKHEWFYETNADYARRFDAALQEANAALRQTADAGRLAGGEVDGCPRQSSHPSSALIEKRAA